MDEVVRECIARRTPASNKSFNTAKLMCSRPSKLCADIDRNLSRTW